MVSSVASYSFSVLLLDGRRGMVCDISRAVLYITRYVEHIFRPPSGSELDQFLYPRPAALGYQTFGRRELLAVLGCETFGRPERPTRLSAVGAAGGPRVRDFWPGILFKDPPLALRLFAPRHPPAPHPKVSYPGAENKGKQREVSYPSASQKLAFSASGYETFGLSAGRGSVGGG